MLISNREGDQNASGLLERAVDLVRAGKSSRFVLVVPTRERARSIAAELVRAKSGGAVGGLAVTTLTDLATKLLDAAAPHIRVITDAEVAVFLELSILRLLKDEQLRYFEGKKAIAHGLPISPGTFEQIQNTIRRLREHDVSPSHYRAAVEKSAKKGANQSEALRAEDMLKIYEAYLSQLGATTTDVYGQFRFLIEYLSTEPDGLTLQHCIESVYPGAEDIFLHDFLRLEASSLLLVSALAEIKSVAVEIPEHPDNRELFEPLKHLEDSLFTAGLRYSSRTRTAGSPRPIASEQAEKDLPSLGQLLGESMFIPRLAGAASSDRTPEERITVARATTREKEVDWIAREIKQIFERDADARQQPSRICVASFREGDYTMLFRESFERHGIPASVTDRDRLENAPIVASFLALLGLAADGYRRRELRRVLSSPYFDFKRPDGRSIDRVNLLEVAERERLTGSYDRWIDRIRSRVTELVRESEALAEEEEESKTRQTERMIDGLRVAESDLGVINEVIKDFEKPVTPQEFLTRIEALIARLNISDAMLTASGLMIGLQALERETRGFGSFRRLLEGLVELFSRLELQDEKLDISFFIERLRVAAQLERYTPRFKPGAVTVTSLDQVIAMECDYLFIPGLVDGAFPSSYEPKIFLHSEVQRGDDRRQLEEERLLFFTTATQPKKRLYLSWFAQTEGGAEQSKSSFILAIQSILSTSEVIAEPSEASIYSYRDLFKFAGRSFLQDREERDAARNVISAQTGETLMLTTLFDFVPQALSVEQQRMTSWNTPYSGVLDLNGLSERAKTELARFKDVVWSVSQLETYASCPFKFLSERVYKLNVVEEANDGLDGMERGSIVHQVLYELFTERATNGLKRLADLTTEAEKAEVRERASALTAELLPNLDSAHPFYRLDSEHEFKEIKGKGIWVRLLEAEAKLKEGSHRPAYFEASFGGKTGSKREQDQQLSRDEPVTLRGIKLRGKIDRIDMDPATFSIVDYKTGRSKSYPQILRGTNLQMPLYLQAAEVMLREYNLAHGLPEVHGVGALYSALKEGRMKVGIVRKSAIPGEVGNLSKRTGALDDDEFTAVLTDTLTKIEGYIERMTEGEFPLVAKDLEASTCQYCAYRSACRVQMAAANEVLPPAPAR